MIAEVRLWGRTIGAVTMDDGTRHAAFQYTPDFAASGIQVAPLMLPLDSRTYEFPELPRRTFHGLPGLLADSLPDRFGNALIDAWLATTGRTPDDFSRSQSSPLNFSEPMPSTRTLTVTPLRARSLSASMNRSLICPDSQM